MPAYPIDLCDTRKQAAAAAAHELIREAKTVQQEFVHSNILTSNSEMLRLFASHNKWRILTFQCDGW